MYFFENVTHQIIFLSFWWGSPRFTGPNLNNLKFLDCIFFFSGSGKKKYRKSQKGVSEWLSIFSREKIKYDTFALTPPLIYVKLKKILIK